MLFTLKKYLGSMLLPLPFALIIMAISIIFLWLNCWTKTAKILLSISWLLLLCCSLQPIADSLLAPIEAQYPSWNGKQQPQYIVVLGGGYTWDPNWVPSSNLAGSSLARVTEGIRQWRRFPQAKLIFTGAAAKGNPRSNAAVAAEVTISLAVPADKIIVLEHPKDTQQEAKAVAHIVSHHCFLLVTSANHLPRAMHYFQMQGLQPIPVPANQMAVHRPLAPWQKFIPSGIWLIHSERAWYETLGGWWQKMQSTSAEPSKTPLCEK